MPSKHYSCMCLYIQLHVLTASSQEGSECLTAKHAEHRPANFHRESYYFSAFHSKQNLVIVPNTRPHLFVPLGTELVSLAPLVSIYKYLLGKVDYL